MAQLDVPRLPLTPIGDDGPGNSRAVVIVADPTDTPTGVTPYERSLARAPRAVGTVLAALLATGCAEAQPEDPADTPTNYFYDFPATIGLDAGLDPSRVRVGLFGTESSEAYVLLGGVADRRAVSLWVSQPDGGRVRIRILDENGNLDTTIEPEGIAVSPSILLASSSVGELVLDLPFESPTPLDSSYALVVWYDDDQDGVLDLGVTGESEATRAFVIDHEGRNLMLSHMEPELTPSPGESDGDLVWVAYGIDEIGTRVVSDDWPEPWVADLDVAADPPLD